MSELKFQNFLPPYRSLVNPNNTYDYQTHRGNHLTPSEIKLMISRFQASQSQKPKTTFQMKYRSLLSDVSLKATILSRKVSNLKSTPQTQICAPRHDSGRRCRNFSQLPVELQIKIFSFVEDRDAYRNCLYTNKSFYQLAKPFVLRSVSFTSTYRFAQFITCLRLNNTLGSFVIDVDLSKLQAGNVDAQINAETQFNSETSVANSDEAAAYASQVLAGWRDWKFKSNIHVLHPSAIPLNKGVSVPPSISQPSSSASKRIKLTKYFKRRRSSSNVIPQNITPVVSTIHALPEPRESIPAHPRTNRFLLNYASSKDLPVGYILHLINLCPNLQSLNLSNVSMSNDYRVKRSVQYRYQSYDVMNNYHKDMLRIVEAVAPPVLSEHPSSLTSGLKSSFADMTSSASSVFSIGTLSKPVWKYNSLLPPVNFVAPDVHYASRGDGYLYLSDLNLKSLTTANLEIISQNEMFRCLEKRSATLRYLNISSMIWINVKLVQEYLSTILAADLRKEFINGKEVITYKGNHFEIGEPVTDEVAPEERTTERGFTLDLSNSGMIKNLPWARVMNTEVRSGQRTIYRILNDELVNERDESIVRDRIRRGRVGENYFY